MIVYPTILLTVKFTNHCSLLCTVQVKKKADDKVKRKKEKAKKDKEKEKQLQRVRREENEYGEWGMGNGIWEVGTEDGSGRRGEGAQIRGGGKREGLD